MVRNFMAEVQTFFAFFQFNGQVLAFVCKYNMSIVQRHECFSTEAGYLVTRVGGYFTCQCPVLLLPIRMMTPAFFNFPKRRLTVASDTPIIVAYSA